MATRKAHARWEGSIKVGGGGADAGRAVGDDGLVGSNAGGLVHRAEVLARLPDFGPGSDCVVDEGAALRACRGASAV